ncbi:MAG: metal ABC transporter ATP-binding protein [Planctomycetota bacterium]|jgi:zinc transport system ATP-binding protein
MSEQNAENGIAVTFNDVTAVLGGVTVLDKVCATVPRSSCTAIVGPNGAGKTTLLLTLLGQVSHTGAITLGKTSEGQTKKIGYVPQRLTFDRGMPLTVAEFMVMGFQKTPLWFGIRKSYLKDAEENLSSVKAENLIDRKVGALSGGELQRVLLALALSQKPDLLVLDEPAAGVDFQGEYIFCELLDRLRQEQGFTQLMVSHDLATVTHHATHVICLNRKVAAEGAPREVLTDETLTAIFGLHMGLVNSRALSSGEGSCSAPCCSGGPDDA